MRESAVMLTCNHRNCLWCLQVLPVATRTAPSPLMHLTNEIPEDTSKRIKTKLPDKQLQGIEAHDLQIY